MRLLVVLFVFFGLFLFIYVQFEETSYSDDFDASKVVFVAGKAGYVNKLVEDEWKRSFAVLKYKAAFVPYSKYEGEMAQGSYPFVIYGDRCFINAAKVDEVVTWLESGERFGSGEKTYPPKFLIVFMISGMISMVGFFFGSLLDYSVDSF